MTKLFLSAEIEGAAGVARAVETAPGGDGPALAFHPRDSMDAPAFTSFAP